MFLFVGQLCTNEAVVVVGGARFVLRCQYQQDMRMWKASLLVFDDVHIRDDAALEMLVYEHLQQFLQFEVKHPRDDIWPSAGICRFGARRGFPANFMRGMKCNAAL